MESRGNPRALITAGMLDENGKAYYGVPGPGSYEATTAFRDIKTYENDWYVEDDPGCQVFTAAPAYSMGTRADKPEKIFISQMHNQTYFGTESPGPQYKFKDPTRASAPTAPFTTADRNEEKKARYISRDHCMDALGQESPGPSAYRLRTGKGISKSMGDAPTWVFGTAEQRAQTLSIGQRDAPGPGAHTLPPALGPTESPAYTIGPMGQLELGEARTRDEFVSLWISEEHNRGENTTMRSNPGPGHYADADMNVVRLRHARTAFPQTPRYTDIPNRLFISKDHVEPDPVSPGPAYNYTLDPIAKRAATAAMATSDRMLQPELGGNKGGPFISRKHSETYAGCNSPGPGMYEHRTGKGHFKTLGDCPLYVFGSEDRSRLEKELEAARAVPGPGAYMIRESMGTPGYTMAPCLRTDFTQGTDPDEPGPGGYEVLDGIADNHPAYKGAGTTKFPKAKDRGKFITDQPGYHSKPGPTTYNTKSKYYDLSVAAPKFSFGIKDKRKAGGKSLAGYRYHGPLHASAEGYGADSPGPGTYDSKYGKGHAKSVGDAPNMKFGTAARMNNNLFISDAHNRSVGAKGELPGPGHYTTTNNFTTSKHKNRGGCSFGTAKRPFGGTVKF